MTATTANTQEARDFKVVVTVDNPPASLRPGLSATARIQTAHKDSVLTVPIQALAVRSQKTIEEARQGDGANVTLAASNGDAALGGANADIQGVFVVREKKAVFVPVQTGITGITDIEVTNGLQEGDQIIVGSYKALRSLRPGGRIKVDNSPPKHDDTSSS
jgi:HlyD family secretion protein